MNLNSDRPTMNDPARLRQTYLREILPRVQKPARYIGGEWNQVNKPLDGLVTRVALAFPDVYEIGVSYLGYKILYDVFNRQAGVYAERVYSPWPDLEALLREQGLPLVSLETFTPLHRFDWLGITLQHELSYSNILNLLDLGRIPLLSRDRTEAHPLVMAGGPGAANPEPLADALDVVVIGDGETVVLDLLKLDPDLRARPRKDRLRELARVPGVYVPSLYRPAYAANGRFAGITAEPGAPLPVRRRQEPPPDAPQRPIVPFLAATHDRVTTELFRGCTHGCRYCQAGMITRPVRERDPGAVIEQVLATVANTGYEEASLVSLSSGDYSQILPLVRELMARLSSERVALSFPSLRLDSFQRELAETVRSVRKTGLTFAPEAASERLRRSINKDLRTEGLAQAVAEVFAEGWDLVKLYFMIGLPGEAPADVEAVGPLIRQMLREARAAGSARRAPRLNLSINLFVPKPHTPFQWEPQLDRATAAGRLQTISRDLPRGVDYRFGARDVAELDRAYLEAAFARGDRRLWDVAHRAWAAGARFDSWTEWFRFDRWTQAFAEAGLEPDEYVRRERPEDEPLPWDHLDLGVSKEYLRQERARAREALVTPDCRQAGCQGCGAADPKACPLPPAKPWPKLPAPGAPAPGPERESVRLRLRYAKTGRLRFVGHLDLVNTLRRALRRARLPLHYSLGFHPQPSLAFGPPLPLGYQGAGEWLDVGLDAWRDPRETVIQLNAVLPEGLSVLAGREIPLGAPSLSESIQAGEYRLVFPDHPGVRESVAEKARALLAAETMPGRQWSKQGEVAVDLRPAVLDLALAGDDPGTFILRHLAPPTGGAKVPAILEHLCAGACETWRVEVTRTASGRWQGGQIMVP